MLARKLIDPDAEEERSNPLLLPSAPMRRKDNTMGYTTYANCKFAWFTTESGRAMVICDHGSFITSHRTSISSMPTDREVWHSGNVILNNETMEIDNILNITEWSENK